MAVSKRLRYEILRRDNHACRYCGATAPNATLTIDHVTPLTLGGTDDPSNLVTACADCNSGKSSSAADSALVADVEQDAVRWSAAIRRAAALEEARRAELDVIHANVWDYWVARNNQWAYPPSGWEATVDRLIESGLTMADLTEAMDIALDAFGVTQRNRWRYFCGVCWKRVERRQEAARAILTAEDGGPDAP